MLFRQQIYIISLIVNKWGEIILFIYHNAIQGKTEMCVKAGLLTPPHHSVYTELICFT